MKDLPKDKHVELVVTSPMRRTLETTNAALDFLIEKGVKVEVDADRQGNSTHSPDLFVMWHSAIDATCTDVSNADCVTISQRSTISHVIPEVPYPSSSVGSLFSTSRESIQFIQTSLRRRARVMPIPGQLSLHEHNPRCESCMLGPRS